MTYKLLIHINEDTKWNMLFSNVINFKLDMDSKSIDFDLVIVINGAAVSSLLNEAVLSNITNSKASNITYKVCNNSLKGRNMDISNHLDLYEIVETSVVEITERQLLDNFAYLKL